jgi:hypothetical protein
MVKMPGPAIEGLNEVAETPLPIHVPPLIEACKLTDPEFVHNGLTGVKVAIVLGVILTRVESEFKHPFKLTFIVYTPVSVGCVFNMVKTDELELFGPCQL